MNVRLNIICEVLNICENRSMAILLHVCISIQNHMANADKIVVDYIMNPLASNPLSRNEVEKKKPMVLLAKYVECDKITRAHMFSIGSLQHNSKVKVWIL